MTTIAIWTKGKRVITGSYTYDRASQRFYITLNVKDAITGSNKRYITADGDTPEWNGWRLKREEKQDATRQL